MFTRPGAEEKTSGRDPKNFLKEVVSDFFIIRNYLNFKENKKEKSISQKSFFLASFQFL